MRHLYLGDLATPPEVVEKDLTEVFTALRDAAWDEGDFQAFLQGELGLKALSIALAYIEDPSCFSAPAPLLFPEDSDTVAALIVARFG